MSRIWNELYYFSLQLHLPRFTLLLVHETFHWRTFSFVTLKQGGEECKRMTLYVCTVYLWYSSLLTISFSPKSSQMKADANYQANAAKSLQLILSHGKVWPGDRSKTERLRKTWIPGCLRNIDRSGSLHPMHLAFPFPWPPFILLIKCLYWSKKGHSKSGED